VLRGYFSSLKTCSGSFNASLYFFLFFLEYKSYFGSFATKIFPELFLDFVGSTSVATGTAVA
jgi:hypothetical protein